MNIPPILRRHLIFILLNLFVFQTPLSADDSTGVALRVETLLKKAKGFYNYDPDSLAACGKEILKISEKNGYIKGIAEAYNMIGLAEKDAGNSYQAILNYKKGIAAASGRNLEKELATILLNKGGVEEITGNYVSALNDYLKSIEIRQKLKDSLGVAKCLNNIAQVYSRQGNKEKALEYFMQSLEIKKKFNDSLSIAKTYNNIGVMYTELQQYTTALKYFENANQLYMIHGSEKDIAPSIGNIAWTYDLMGLKDTALTYYLSSLSYSQKSGELFDQAVTHINVGSLYLEKGDYTNAMAHLKEGLLIARNINSKEDIREAYKYLALLYAQKKDFEKAYEMQFNFQGISDSILNEEKSEILTEMHIKYETEKKDEENRFLLKENELQKAILERNAYVNWGMLIFIVMVMIIALLIVQQSRLRTEQVTMQLEQKILRSQMNPHFIFNSLQSIQGYIFEQNALEAGKYLADFSKLMRLILENSFYEKITMSKEIETLTYYLNLQKMRFSDKLSYHIDIDPELDSDRYEVPPMILQPFIENAIEHGIKPKAGKGNISISIKLVQNSIIFTLLDDGVGRISASNNFSENKHKSRAMAITHERMTLFNRKSKRKMSITITDLISPTGTKVVINIPIK